uniref:Uncharacterized protein n=1 Tax=Cucumis melo TaxID=3656 RepID=A0A9I9E6A5_CUCME
MKSRRMNGRWGNPSTSIFPIVQGKPSGDTKNSRRYVGNTNSQRLIQVRKNMSTVGRSLNANAAQMCCNNHPSLGRCKPGVDDSPGGNGKCWSFCISGCTKGGFCKHVGRNGHVCHCYC